MASNTANLRREQTEVAIIGAGPAGTLAAALLCESGHQVTVLERATFPRFSIGESLLPQCMTFIEDAGMEQLVADEQFQLKNGAVFLRDGTRTDFDFNEKFSPGPGTTYQVQRNRFDQVLAQAAADKGADLRFASAITDVQFDSDGRSALKVQPENADAYELNANIVLDASGFGRVLSRLLDLESPSGFPTRMSVFTHIEDNITDPNYDRNKIIIAIHPKQADVWYWLIPFSNGRCSLGVVAREEYFADKDLSPAEQLKAAVTACPDLDKLLAAAKYDTPVNAIQGYSCNVSSLWGKGYVLLGNAGEFLDPVFSSGVTIAMKSASLAAPLVSRQLQGQSVDWDSEFVSPLKIGIDTFRAYVDSWYEGGFQDVIFAPKQQANIREMICSILAGYAWDTNNPFVKEPARRLKALATICGAQRS